MRLYNFLLPSLVSFHSLFFSLATNAMCSVQSPSHIPSSRIAARWFTSSLALEGVCLKPSELWTIASTLFSSLPLSFSHTPHLRSRLPQELKKPIRVLHAGRGVCRCVPSDRNMETWQKNNCPNKENYVRAEECQSHVGVRREEISALTRLSRRNTILSRISGPVSLLPRVHQCTWCVRGGPQGAQAVIFIMMSNLCKHNRCPDLAHI